MKVMKEKTNKKEQQEKNVSFKFNQEKRCLLKKK